MVDRRDKTRDTWEADEVVSVDVCNSVKVAVGISKTGVKVQ